MAPCTLSGSLVMRYFFSFAGRTATSLLSGLTEPLSGRLPKISFDQVLNICRQRAGNENHTTAVQIILFIKFFYHSDVKCCIVFHRTVSAIGMVRTKQVSIDEPSAMKSFLRRFTCSRCCIFFLYISSSSSGNMESAMSSEITGNNSAKFFFMQCSESSAVSWPAERFR